MFIADIFISLYLAKMSFPQVNLEFRLLYPNHCDNFLMKWDSYFKERIIALGKEEYPAVKQLISSYKENGKL